MKLCILALFVSLFSFSASSETSLILKSKQAAKSVEGAQPLELNAEMAEKAEQRKLSVWQLSDGSPQYKQFAARLTEKLLNDSQFKFVPEKFEVGSGSVDVGGFPLYMVFRFSQQRPWRDESFPNNFGAAGFYTDVLVDGDFQDALVQEVMIPIDAEGKIAVEEKNVYDLIVASHSTPYLIQSEVMKYNSRHPNPEFENITDEQFVLGVKNLANHLNSILENGDISLPGDSIKNLGGGDYLIYGSDYIPNPNLNVFIDIPFDIPLSRFKSNFTLMMLLFSVEDKLPDPECLVSTVEEQDALHAHWTKQITGYVEKYDIFEWDSFPDTQLTCN